MIGRSGRFAITGGVALALVLVVAAPASAHDSLQEASPAEGATVSSLEEVSLTYTGNLLNMGEDINALRIQVVGPDGRYYSDACTELDGPTLSVPVQLGAAGEYEVQWRVVSADGHPISDTYPFTYTPAEGTATAPGQEQAPTCGDPVSAAPDSERVADEPSTAQTDDGSLVLGLAIGAAVIGVLTLGTVMLVRRMRRS